MSSKLDKRITKIEEILRIEYSSNSIDDLNEKIKNLPDDDDHEHKYAEENHDHDDDLGGDCDCDHDTITELLRKRIETIEKIFKIKYKSSDIIDELTKRIETLEEKLK